MACDAGLLVLPECLDQSFASSMMCFPLTVRLPRLDQSRHTYNLLAPISTSRENRDAQDASEARYAGDSEWGCVQSWRDPDDWKDPPIPTSAIVEQFRFHTEGAAGDDVEFQGTLDHFGRHQSDWWQRLAEWVGVVSSQDLIGLGKNRRARAFLHLTMWIAKPAEGQESSFARLNIGDVRGYCGDPLTKEQLSRCLTLAGGPTRPPDAWLLMRDARSLFRADEYRRAILDIGTAAELALTAMLARHASASGAADVIRVVNKTRMLGNLRNLAAELIPEALPAQLKERVITPRNSATHEARPLTKETAAMAIDTTTELLKTAYPLTDFGFRAIKS